MLQIEFTHTHIALSNLSHYHFLVLFSLRISSLFIKYYNYYVLFLLFRTVLKIHESEQFT